MAYPAGACHSHAGKQAPVVQYNTDLGNKTPAFTFVSNIAARHQSGVLNPTSSSGLLAVCFSVFCFVVVVVLLLLLLLSPSFSLESLCLLPLAASHYGIAGCIQLYLK